MGQEQKSEHLAGEAQQTRTTSDTQRLDWLERRQALLNTASGGRPHVNVDQNNSLHEGNHFFGQNYRDAIDAAMASELQRAARPLLIAAKIAYAILAPIGHNWNGRHTPEGQGALSVLRDAIAQAEGREPQDVQDEYANL